MGRDFYTFTGENHSSDSNEHDIEREMFGLDENGFVPFPARIAIYDDPTVTPRVIIIEPKDIHSFLEEITKNVYLLAKEQGGSFPYNIVREVVENYIHALFLEPTISIMDGGNTIKFSDRGPGIQNKELALEIGASSANPQMKRYIRGVGSGLPIVKNYLQEKGGSLLVQDNLSEGTVVTITLLCQDNSNNINYPEDEQYWIQGNNPNLNVSYPRVDQYPLQLQQGYNQTQFYNPNPAINPYAQKQNQRKYQQPSKFHPQSINNSTNHSNEINP